MLYSTGKANKLSEEIKLRISHALVDIGLLSGTRRLTPVCPDDAQDL